MLSVKSCSSCSGNLINKRYFDTKERRFIMYDYCKKCTVQCSYCNYKLKLTRNWDFRNQMTISCIECTNCGHCDNPVTVSEMRMDKRKRDTILEQYRTTELGLNEHKISKR